MIYLMVSRNITLEYKLSELFVPNNITFGSNRFLNTNGVISVSGKELFKMKIANCER